MEREFWLEKWDADDIGFHRDAVNPLLEKYWPTLGVPVEAGVFVPLCGKSLDMRWLEALGHHVFGVELSEKAVQAYFAEAGESPEISRFGNVVKFECGQSTLYCTDFIELSILDIKTARGVYDRGALVALPTERRERYADHIQRILPDGTVTLLLTLEYDQAVVAGPPFSVTEQEVRRLYGERCTVDVLGAHEPADLPPKFAAAGLTKAIERVYKIVKNH